jgi:hypothetical protein
VQKRTRSSPVAGSSATQLCDLRQVTSLLWALASSLLRGPGWHLPLRVVRRDQVRVHPAQGLALAIAAADPFTRYGWGCFTYHHGNSTHMGLLTR